MSIRIRRVTYAYAGTEDRPGAIYQLLAQLAEAEVDLLAFSAVPIGPNRAQLTLFPRDFDRLAAAAPRLGLSLGGEQQAFLVQGDDELGALADVHRTLFDARINVFAANGVTDGQGRFGYLIYVRPEDYERAAGVLEV
jgi:hypothetical protein